MTDQTQTTQSTTQATQATPQAEAKAVVPVKDHAPAIYGGKDEVRSLAARIMSIHPSAKKIGNQGALLLAQLGIALGLNPLPGSGHIHAWIDKQGAMLVHVGVEGRIALAERQSKFTFSTRPMRGEEAEENDLKAGERGAICELYRHDLTKSAAACGLPVTPIIGIGIVRANEYPPNGRSLFWRAKQRALKDALRLAFPIELPHGLIGAVRVADSETEVPSNIIEGEIAEPAEPITEPTPEPTTEAQPTRPYPPEALRGYLLELSAKHEGKTVNPKQRGLLAGKLDEIFAPADDAESQRKALTRYLFGTVSTKDLTPSQVIGVLDWLNLQQDSGGEYLIDSLAIKEARGVIAQVMQEAGAQPLPLFDQSQTVTS